MWAGKTGVCSGVYAVHGRSAVTTARRSAQQLLHLLLMKARRAGKVEAEAEFEIEIESAGSAVQGRSAVTTTRRSTQLLHLPTGHYKISLNFNFCFSLQA